MAKTVADDKPVWILTVQIAFDTDNESQAFDLMQVIGNENGGDNEIVDYCMEESKPGTAALDPEGYPIEGSAFGTANLYYHPEEA